MNKLEELKFERDLLQAHSDVYKHQAILFEELMKLEFFERYATMYINLAMGEPETVIRELKQQISKKDVERLTPLVKNVHGSFQRYKVFL